MGNVDWSKEELAVLKKLNAAGVTDTKISKELGRSVASVEHQRRAQRWEKPRRVKKLTPAIRQDLTPMVNMYLQSAQKIFDQYADIFAKTKFKGAYSNVKQTEQIVLNWSDMHSGETNKSPITGKVTYNEAIQQKELLEYQKGVYRFYELYRKSYNIDTLHIFSLGDMITNDRIFDGQLFEISCCVGEQVQKTIQIMASFINWASQYFPNVVVHHVIGNHGRSSDCYNEPVQNNFEYGLGKHLEAIFKDNKRVTINVAENLFYSTKILGHKFLLTHGHMIRGMSLNTIEKAAKEFKLLLEGDPHEVMNIGHFHTALLLPIGKTSLVVNGSFVNDDTFAFVKLRKQSIAQQVMYNVSKKSALHNWQRIELNW